MVRKFLGIRKFLNFRNVTYSTENSVNPGREMKWKGNFRSEIFDNFGTPYKLPSFLIIPEDASPFAEIVG